MEIKNFDCSVEYDKLAEMYDSYYCPTWPLDDNIQGLVDYLKTWSGGDKILEVGIGTGNVAGKLYLEGYHNITGIDASENMTGRLKYKCPKAKLIIENLNDTKFYNYDWVLMISGVTERVEHKQDFFQKVFDQADEGMKLFIDIDADEEYKPIEEVDPTRDQCYEFFNHKRNVHVKCEYRQHTPSHHSGMYTYTNADTNQTIHYKFSKWEITQKDMINLMQEIGFKNIAIGLAEDTGYYQDILVFEK